MKKQALDLLYIAKGLIANSSILEGLRKPQAVNFVNKILRANTRGFYTDNGWVPVYKIWSELSKAGIEVHHDGDKYDHDSKGEMISKTWRFHIDFYNNRDRLNTLYGVVIASGAGTVKDPLSRYDLVAYVS